MKKIFCKDTPDAMAKIRAALEQGEAVNVCNEYETVYGLRFDPWLREGLAGMDVEIIEGRGYQWEYGYPFEYIITPIRR